MMPEGLFRLYPTPAQQVELRGLYLKENLRAHVEEKSATSFVYANFIASLDGRIAVPDPSDSGVILAEAVTNPRDWRLFQELAVQSDIVISTGRYMREYARGAKQELLQVYQDPEFADLRAWRSAQGLPRFPDIAVISRRLDFQVPEILQQGDRALLVFTVKEADHEEVARLRDAGAVVVPAGEQDVDGSRMIASLEENGYKVIYSAAGPRVLHLLASSGVLNRLYLSVGLRLLGGEPYSTILEGRRLEPPADFDLVSMYLDERGLGGIGQLFTCFRRTRPARP